MDDFERFQIKRKSFWKGFAVGFMTLLIVRIILAALIVETIVTTHPSF